MACVYWKKKEVKFGTEAHPIQGSTLKKLLMKGIGFSVDEQGLLWVTEEGKEFIELKFKDAPKPPDEINSKSKRPENIKRCHVLVAVKDGQYPSIDIGTGPVLRNDYGVAMHPDVELMHGVLETIGHKELRTEDVVLCLTGISKHTYEILKENNELVEKYRYRSIGARCDSCLYWDIKHQACSIPHKVKRRRVTETGIPVWEFLPLFDKYAEFCIFYGKRMKKQKTENTNPVNAFDTNTLREGRVRKVKRFQIVTEEGVHHGNQNEEDQPLEWKRREENCEEHSCSPWENK